MEWMILPLRRYAQFSGRSTRREFWMWVLFVILVSFVLSIVDKLLGLGGAAGAGSQTVTAPGFTGYRAGAGFRGGILTGIFALAILIPNIAVSVRRLHDTDRSGWWVLLPVIPYFGGALLVGVGLAAGRGMALIGGLLLLVGLVCAIVLLVWYCLRGTPGANRFGADPLVPLGDLHDTFR